MSLTRLTVLQKQFLERLPVGEWVSQYVYNNYCGLPNLTANRLHRLGIVEIEYRADTEHPRRKSKVKYVRRLSNAEYLQKANKFINQQ